MRQLSGNARRNRSRRAIIAAGVTYNYDQLLQASAGMAAILLAGTEGDLNEQRVAFMVTPGFEYVQTQWGIWRAGGVAVPLSLSYPLPSLRYVVEDTGATVLVAEAGYADLLAPLAEEKGIRLIRLDQLPTVRARRLPVVADERRAMILYTSGTTSLPKGVVTTHANLAAQISTLVKAWQWAPDDHIVCVLPLHHVHGIVNVVSCALWAGATVTFLPQFTAEAVLDLFRYTDLNLFMAVPTIYFKLVAAIDTLDEAEKAALKRRMEQFRLMVCGSAALPVSVMEKWETLSGHRLLERYGMTEIGMGISNPYAGERRAGYIGKPLPGVKVRLVDEQNQVVRRGQPGEIQVKGKNVFQEYWGKPEATQKAFTEDGWFKTGDIAVVEKGYYRILGRDSVDIIKSGGYKISALEIEEVLRTHPDIADCSVVGLPDEEWGEIVAAVLVIRPADLDTGVLNKWLRERMPAYKTPRLYRIVPELPRNAMGKVTKNDLKPLFQ